MSTILAQVKALIPGTSEYESKDRAMEVMRRWKSGEQVYFKLENRILANKSFYEGEITQQFNPLNVEGDLRIVTNVGATVMDLMCFLISNNPPSLQAIARGSKKTDQIEASIAEDLVQKAFRDAGLIETFKDSVKMLVSYAGFFWWFPFWNTEVEFGKQKNHVDLTLLPPLRTRVFYATTDYKKVAHFVTIKRMLPEDIYKMYGIEAFPDSQNPIISQFIQGPGIEDGKVTVFKDYDSEYCTTIIDNQEVSSEPHGLDFAPIIQVNNVWLINEAHGETDLARFQPLAQELNMLVSAASEITRDKAWAPLLEYNSALGGKKISKWRNQKIPVRRTDKGEALQYLVSVADIQALMGQINLMIDLLHFVSLVPKAAAGVFQSSVTSGFQAQLAMQPVTLAANNKKISIDTALIRLAKTFLYLIEKNDPKSLEIGPNIRIKDLWQIDFKVVWPENLPTDIAREIQNLAVGIDKNLTSVSQGIDKYNVLMGMGSTEDTISYLDQEAKDPDINPDKALKLAQLQILLGQAQTANQSIQQKVAPGSMPPGQGTPPNATPDQQNPNNMAASLGSNPQNTGTTNGQPPINQNSTGGVTVTPTPQGIQ